MAAITATSLAVAQANQPGGPPLVAIITSTSAVYTFNFNTCVWTPIPMVTT